MDPKVVDYTYHRSRIDSHVQGAVVFTVLVAVLAFLIGDRFKPFQQGARFWSPTALVWTPETRVWQPAELLWSTDEVLDRREKYLVTPTSGDQGADAPTGSVAGEYLLTRIDPSPVGDRIVKEVYPISYSILFVVGSLLVWTFLYRCAKRQAGLMRAALPDGDAPRASQQVWERTQATLWALFAVLVVELLLFVL
ncbi:MAG: hypothetical protein JSV19_07465 [Phycisphaerales bacterium]|nr:MAG: hypothetical protein JSV19_07465 [Phycisphaerales bacterium]